MKRMGLGLAALGRPGYINLGHAEDLGGDYEVAAMERHTHQMLDSAYSLGIRYFDAARSYGQAEAFLSSWLKAHPAKAEKVFVGSKWGYTYTAGWQISASQHEVKDHSLPTLDRQWKISESLLGGHLQLYQVHSATLESGILENAAVHRRLHSLKEKGIQIGLSLSGPQQADTLEAAMRVAFDGIPLFDSVQATFNLLEVSAGPALEAAHAQGLKVIIKEALANGRLTERNPDPAFTPLKRALKALAQDSAGGIDAAALAFVLAHPWVDIVLSGAAQVSHLESNLAAREIEWEAA